MVANKHDVLKQALTLPESDRLELAEALTCSMDVEHQREIDQAWLEECLRRKARVERGEEKLIPAEEVSAELRTEHRARIDQRDRHA